MSRSPRIRKKKSFMFTTKHHTFEGWIGLIIAIITVSVWIACAISSYDVQGNVSLKYGGVGLFSLLLSVFGVLFGIMGLKERDAYKSIPVLVVVINSIVILMWILVIVMSAIANN